MTQEELQKEILKSNAAIKTGLDSLLKRFLSTSDRKFLFELVTKVVKPASVDSMIGQGVIVLAAATSATVVEQNQIRFTTTIINAGANDAYLAFQDGPAIATAGILLRANGGTMAFGRGTDMPYQGRVTGISTLGTTLVITSFNLPVAELEF